MEERDLVEIESRTDQYPPQAREDVLRLTREIRRLTGADRPTAVPALTASSPLYDAVTGLLNGGAYGVRFAMARARATRFRKIFAVMSIEAALEQESPGTPLGEEDRDLTIRQIAERLEQSVRATDTLARIGGGNFAVILEDLTHSGHAERVKQIVQEALAEPVVLRDRTYLPQISVGMEFYPAPHPSGTH